MKAKILTLPVIELDGTFEEIAEIIKRYTKTLAIIESNPPEILGERKSKPCKPKKPKLGISKKSGRKSWTKDDELELKKCYDENLPIGDYAEKTNRTESSVKQKLIKMINSGKIEQKKKE
jgi:hypothetical protein